MARVVDRGFCVDRCYDRGVCVENEDGYRCFCYEPSSYANCGGPIASSTYSSTVSSDCEPSPDAVVIVGAIVALFALVLLVISSVVMWHRRHYVRRSEVDATTKKKEGEHGKPSAPVDVTDV